MTDLEIKIPEEPTDGEEPKYEEVETDKYSEAYARRTPRIYCLLLMSTVGSLLCSAENPHQLVQAILDAILGYWRLVNLGLLHRDISDGNVLLLQNGDGYGKREWENPQTKTKELDSTLVKSEQLLQDVLDKLGRDPTGMLNDFDLFTTHSGMGAAFFSNVPSNNQEAVMEEPGSKRRKLNPEGTASVLSSSSSQGEGCEALAPKESSLTLVTSADKGARHGIDFRTGTPTFMSLRVLRVQIGQPYEHSFMDDLESFFWLVFWCIVEHVDSPDVEPTKAARDMLNLLDRSELQVIEQSKGNILGDCGREDGDGMRDRLSSYKNAWASDPMIINLLLELGQYFNGISRKKIDQYTPPKVFPKIVGALMDALD
ncbi:hypothetical protein FRC07_003713 [Ceratobasidium sp. 392]|nr:hypothetical protein FRC07_003713 [Ceratobasidium sp. 392]